MAQGPYKNVKPGSLAYSQLYGAPSPLNATELGMVRTRLAHNNVMHIDGNAWPKCCYGDREYGEGYSIDCAYTAGRLDKHSGADPLIPFVCIHRTQDGYLRVCAGWDACHGKEYAELLAKGKAKS